MLDLCTRRESAEKIEKLLPKIENVSKREKENWAIKALPSDWKPVHLPSIAVQNVTKKREAEHNSRIEQMESEFAGINSKVESRIRLKSEWIKQDYAHVQQQSETRMTSKIKDDPSKLAMLQPQDFEEIARDIQEFHEQHLDKIKEFYEYLMRLERTRCYHFKIILRSCFEDLHEVSFKLPKELQEIFEHRILNINQITLSNLRCYHDICTTLQLQGENSIRRWLQALTSLKDKWKAAQKEQATQKLIDFRMASEPELLQKEVAKNVNIQFDLKQKDPTYSSSLSQMMLVPFQAKDVNEWCSAVETEIKDLGYTTKTLVNLYRGAIIQVFNGYMEEFQNISEKMIDSGVVDDSELELFNKEVAVPIIDEMSTKLATKISETKVLWEEVSSKLEQQTKTTVSFLRGAALIWDAHFDRNSTLKTTILKELDQAIEMNNKLSEKKEAVICIATDKLRQESTKGALDKGLAHLNKLLDDLQEEYVNDCQKELSIIKKYPELAREDTELLMKELRQFLNAYPKKAVEIRRASRCEILEEPELILPAQMKMCEYEVQALDNWMLGLWEAIDKYLLTCAEDSAEKNEQWKDTHVKRILKRLEIKVAFHKSRYDRTRINIYNTRLAELEAHMERFERHKTEILIQIQEMVTEKAAFENKLQMLVEKDCEDLEARVQRKVETTKSSQKASAIAYEVGLASKKLQDHANDFLKEYFGLTETKQNQIVESNHEFRKSIKLFSDDGNFSQDEATRYFNELKKLEATLNTKVQTLRKEMDAKSQKVKAALQQKCTSLENMLKSLKEELQFREEVITEIRKVQADIKMGIYDKKYTLQRFSAEIRRLQHPVFSDVANFSRFKTNFNDLVERILGFEMYLLQKDIDPDAVSTSSGLRVSKTVSTISRTVSPRSKGSSGTTSSSTAKFSADLFKVRPPDTCTFLSEFNTALYDSLEKIKQLARRFYGKGRVVKNVDLLQPNLQLFMEEVVKKYSRYRHHVEMAWLDVINETLKLLRQLLHFIWKHYEIILQNFCETKIKEADNECNRKIKTAEAVQEKYERANKEWHDKLKVHFGYVNNRFLLDFCLKEAEKLKSKLKVQSVFDWFNEYESKQRTIREKFLKELDFLEDDLKVLRGTGFCLVNAKLIQQFEEKLQPKSHSVKSTASIRKDKMTTTWTTISEVSLQYENLKSQSKVSSERKAGSTPKNTLASSSSSLARDIPKHSFMNIDEQVFYKESLTKEDVIKAFDEESNKRLANVKVVQETFTNEIQKWTKIWAASKERVLNLYAVKYENTK